MLKRSLFSQIGKATLRLSIGFVVFFFFLLGAFSVTEEAGRYLTNIVFGLFFLAAYGYHWLIVLAVKKTEPKPLSPVWFSYHILSFSVHLFLLALLAVFLVPMQVTMVNPVVIESEHTLSFSFSYAQPKLFPKNVFNKDFSYVEPVQVKTSVFSSKGEPLQSDRPSYAAHIEDSEHMKRYDFSIHYNQEAYPEGIADFLGDTITIKHTYFAEFEPIKTKHYAEFQCTKTTFEYKERSYPAYSCY